MAAPKVQNDPIINLPFLYKYGLQLSLSNDLTLSISAGTCRDSNNVMDIVVGGQNVEGESEPASLTLNFAVNGVNGLDAGTITGSEMYAIYLIADSRYYLPTACIATLDSNDFPLVPMGYDSIRLIGYWPSEIVSAVLQTGYYSGISNDLTFYYDGVRPVLLNGVSTTPANFQLGSTIPLVDNVPVTLACIYTPAGIAPTSLFNILYAVSGGTQGTLGGQVATVPFYSDMEAISQLVMDIPTLQYTVSAGDSVNVDLVSFSISV